MRREPADQRTSERREREDGRQQTTGEDFRASPEPMPLDFRGDAPTSIESIHVPGIGQVPWIDDHSAVAESCRERSRVAFARRDCIRIGRPFLTILFIVAVVIVIVIPTTNDGYSTDRSWVHEANVDRRQARRVPKWQMSNQRTPNPKEAVVGPPPSTYRRGREMWNHAIHLTTVGELELYPGAIALPSARIPRRRRPAYARVHREIECRRSANRIARKGPSRTGRTMGGHEQPWE